MRLDVHKKDYEINGTYIPTHVNLQIWSKLFFNVNLYKIKHAFDKLLCIEINFNFCRYE